MKMRWCLVVVMVAGFGCGESDSGISSIEELRSKLAQSFCRQAFECDPDGRDGITSEAQCREAMGLVFSAFLAPEIDRGWAEFDSEMGQRCFDEGQQAIHAVSCGTMPEIPDICGNPSKGLQGEGEQCGETSDDGHSFVSFTGACQGDLYCSNPDDGDGHPICIVPLALGAECESRFSAIQCVDSAYCPYGGDDHVCTALTPIGEPCEGSRECGDDAECNMGNVCALYED